MASLPANAIALVTDPCLSPAFPLLAAPSAIRVPARCRLPCGRRSAGFSSAEDRPPFACTVLSTLYLKMCGRPLWPIEIADEVFHCQLRFADHGASGALDQPFVSLFGTCDPLHGRPDESRWRRIVAACTDPLNTE